MRSSGNTHSLVLGLMLFVLACNTSLADFGSRRWEFYREIQPAGENPEFAQVVIDREVYCRSQEFPSDLRIVTSEGTEVPYLLHTDEGSIEEEMEYSPRILNKSVVRGQYLVFVLDMGKPGMINNNIIIGTSSRNFIYRVEVEGSRDMANWAVLRDDAYIFNVSKDYHAENTLVEYPDNMYRYLRVKVWHNDGNPLQLESVTAKYIKEQPAQEVVLYKGRGVATQNDREQSTDILVDLGCSGLISERVEIDSTDAGYHRMVEIDGSSDRENWVQLAGDGVIMKYGTFPYQRESSYIYLDSQSRYRYLRIRIRNFDNPPISVSRVTVYSFRRRALFSYDRSKTYRLYYGSPVARAPVYDVYATMRHVPTQSVATLQLGPEIRNPQFSVPVFSGPWLDRHPWALWTVLVAVMALLALLTIRLVAQTRQPPGDSSESE